MAKARVMVWHGTVRRFLPLPSILGALAMASCGGSSSSSGQGGERRVEKIPPPAGLGGTAGVGGGAGSLGLSGVGSSAAMGGAAGSANAAGAPSAGSGNLAGATGVDISGRWAMFFFEDPVAVSLSQSGTVLTGRGCCAGISNPESTCCGSIENGSIVGDRAQFGFSFAGGPTLVYSADVRVSANGQRMLGGFGQASILMAWVRIDAASQWLTWSDTVLIDAVLEREWGYALTLSGAPAGGQAFSPDTAYRLRIQRSPVPIVWGDLGPFWAGEMSWHEDEDTLVIGPVPTTDPAFPIGLRLRFEDVVLTAVEAQMSSGDRYLFSALRD